jgi:hypothetical protein
VEITLSSALIVGAVLAIVFLVFALYSFVSEERKRAAFISKVRMKQAPAPQEKRRAA